MKSIVDLILVLATHDIHIYVENGKLKINSPDGVLEDAIMQKIKAHKKELIEYLSNSGDKINIEIPRTGIKEAYSLSSSQRRLWILSQFDEGNIAYNMPGIYVFEGNLDVQALAYSFEKLIERHEILRTIFREDEQGGISQFIHPPKKAIFKIGYRDLRQEDDYREKLKQQVREEICRPFNLASGPLLRACLFQVTASKWIFTYTMHHIISDAWSMDILIKELLLFYNAYTNGKECDLGPLRIQYKDYATWQQAQLSGEALKHHKDYWLKQFEDDLPVLQLPGDKLRPAVKTYNGGKVNKIFKCQGSQWAKSP
jgi:hypothetical protein